MNRVLTLAVASAALGAMTAPLAATADHKPGHGKAPRGTGNLTIDASPNPVRFGRSTTISGRLTGADNGGRTIVLQHDPWPYGTEYNPGRVAETTTNAQGEYSFRVSPEVNTNYRTVTRGGGEEARSDNQTVGVKVAITRTVSDFTPRRGQTVTFAGTVKPAHDGRTIYIQRRRSDGSWRTVATDTLDAAPGDVSTYERDLRINRDGTYRVKINTHGDHLGNKTRRVRLDVP